MSLSLELDGWYWLSSYEMTVGVRVENGIITAAPPIVRKFMGQPLGNLRRWFARHHHARVEYLGGDR